MPIVTGESVILREYRQEDLPEIRKWVNDADTTKFLSSRFWPPQTMADTQEFLERMLRSSHNGCNFVIAQRQDERYVGQLDIFRLDWKLRCGEIGIVIGAQADRGRGVGREALGLLLRYAFDSLGLERVELTVDTGNQPARRCYENAGFVLEGVKRHAFYREGAFRDIGMYSVLRGEWLTREGRA